MSEEKTGNWLALMIGNSRLHWGWFENATLRQRWDTAHLSAEAVDCLIQHKFDFNQCDLLVNAAIDRPALAAPLWIASVVPAQTQLWQRYAGARLLSLEQVPIKGLYPTMGIDRALALWGAANSLGLPALVIDAGTALTLTGADATGRFVGGAILPGLGLQMQSLAEHTAALPSLSNRLDKLQLTGSLPLRWATNTPDAMISGVLYALLAGMENFIQDWLRAYPGSTIALTGGDGNLLCHCWQHYHPQRSWTIKADPDLVFWGMQSAIEQMALALPKTPVNP